jgi:hypothetical protein
MKTLAEQFVRARDGERATKDSSKGGMDKMLCQIATYKLAMASAKWPTR